MTACSIYALARDVEICVIDGQRRFGNERLLPAGPAARAADAPGAGRLSRLQRRARRSPANSRCSCTDDEAVALHDGARRSLLRRLRGQRVHAVAAIGNPARFFASLRARRHRA